MSRVTVNTSNIDKRIKSWATRGLDVTLEVQDCLVVALDYYQSTPDKSTIYLSKVWRGVVATKGLNANKLKQYVLAACPHLELKKDKAGNQVFLTKAKCKALPAEVLPAITSTLWAEYKQDGGATAFDLEKAIQSLVNKAMKDNDATTRQAIVEAVDKALAVYAVKSSTKASEVKEVAVPTLEAVA